MSKENNVLKEVKETENEKPNNVNKRKFNFVNFLDTYFAAPIVFIILLIALGEICKATLFGKIINVVLGLAFLAWFIWVICRLLKKIIKLSLVWPLATSLGCFISSYICGYANAVDASNILFIVAAILLEIYFLYAIVCNVYSKKIAIGNLITLSLAFLTLGYITIYYASFDSTDPTLFNSLIAVFSAIVGGGLTLGGVAWTIKHEKEEKRREEKQKLLTTCPLLSFREIDKVVHDGKKVNAEDKNPNMLVIDEDKDKKLVENTNMMFRFVFHCNNDIPIKNIHFESIHIYPKYDNQSNMGRDYFFRKVNEDNEEVNVSFLNTNDYQAVAWLVADVEKNQIGELYNNLAVFGKFSKVFIDIVYDTVNIYNVTYKAELKFLCKTTVLVQGDSIEFKVRDYSNVSNWIVEQPHIIEKK